MKAKQSIVIVILLFTIFLNFANCYADSVYNEPISTMVSTPTDVSAISGVTSPMSKVWTTIIRVVQVAAFAGIIFVGIRYMFLSADKKSDVKQSLIIVVLGIILIFGAEPLVKVVYKLVDQLL